MTRTAAKNEGDFRLLIVIINIFSICFFDEHLGFTGQQRKGETISLTPLYYFHPLDRTINISLVVTAESSPLHIASGLT